MHSMQEFLNIISTKRLRSSVMQWLPDKDRELVKLPLTKEQNKYIQELNDTFEIEGTNIDAVNILAKLIKILIYLKKQPVGNSYLFI